MDGHTVLSRPIYKTVGVIAECCRETIVPDRNNLTIIIDDDSTNLRRRIFAPTSDILS
jgi:hypothetical protein